MLREHKWTAGMLLFVLIFYTSMFIADTLARKDESKEMKTVSLKEQAARDAAIRDLKLKEKLMQKRIAENPLLSLGFSLGIILIILGGLVMDLVWILKKWKGERWIPQPSAATDPKWDIPAVFQAFVFLFFIEALLCLFYILSQAMDWMHMPKDYYLLVHSLIRNFAVALFVLLVVRLRFGQGVRDLGMTLERCGSRILEGLRGYLAALPPLFCIFIGLSMILKLMAYEPEPQNVVQIFLKKSTESYLVAFTLFVSILGPVLEEIFFRGFAFAALRKKWGVWPAAVLSSVVFAAFHLNVVAFLPILFLGLFLTYLYESTGSLVAPIAAHIVHNTLMVSLTLLFKALSA